MLDLAVLASAFILAMMLRFDWSPPTWASEQLLWATPWIVFGKYALLEGTRVTRSSWQFTSLREVLRIARFAATASAILVLVRLAAPLVDVAFPSIRHFSIPLGVIIIDLALTTLGLAGVRAVRRVSVERVDQRQPDGERRDPVLTVLIGAGEAGYLVAREIARRPQLALEAVGFLDDDPNKWRTDVHGIRVLGPVTKVQEVAERTGAREALITIGGASAQDVRRILHECDSAGLATKIIPPLHDIVGGRVNLSNVRPVQIEDVLGREPVDLDTAAISEWVRDKVVLVTGAGGSIGSELCRQVLRFVPRRLVMVDRAENSLFELDTELRRADTAIDLAPIIGDVCDGRRMEMVFAQERPDVVFHAAAHKHVPLMELNVGEAVKNNVLGTRIVADLAHAYNAHAFVLVSTDKAVNPTSVMGATKRLAELYVQASAERSHTRFVSVRFGNVLDSAGSVVPIFKRQIAEGGPITVTHPDMRRYFMTIPEACQLILQAGVLGRGGEVFVLDMGEPVKIVDLVRDLITLSGLSPDDIEIVYTGVRPGEKIVEELLLDDEHAQETRHPKIFIGNVRRRPLGELTAQIDLLRAHADVDPAVLIDELRGIVPTYAAAPSVPEILDVRPRDAASTS